MQDGEDEIIMWEAKKMKNINWGSLYATIIICMAIAASCKEDWASRIYRSQPKEEYTREAPDEWKGMEDEHLPTVMFYKNIKPDMVLTVKLTNTAGNHYIEKIGIMDANKKVLVFKEFTTNEKFFEAKFSSSQLPSDWTGLKAFAKCSQHDLWTEPLKKIERK